VIAIWKKKLFFIKKAVTKDMAGARPSGTQNDKVTITVLLDTETTNRYVTQGSQRL
jgi:hypothetical protein